MEIFFSDTIQVIASDRIMALDWDFYSTKPVSSSYSGSTSIGKREDAIGYITTWINMEKALGGIENYGVRCYWTPNGVRAFITSHYFSVGNEAQTIMRRLLVDSNYIFMCGKNRKYCVRVSQKPNREGDYVSCFWQHIGNPVILPEIMDYIKVHDQLCKEYRGQVEIPKELQPTSTLQSLLRYKDEEPWELVHKNALQDYILEVL
jgi:hypothetical protein